MKLSTRVSRLPVSGIRKMFDLAAKYDNVINLGIGEPKFSTPENIIVANDKALRAGFTKYVANAGHMPLRMAIAEKMKRDSGLAVDAQNVIVTFGAGQALMSTMQAILDEGDEILVPNPCFANYMGYIALANGTPVMVPTYESDKFHIKAEVVRQYITSKTKAIIINSPNNPTGAVTPKEELEKLAKLAIEEDLIVISDEPYEKIIFDGHSHYSIASYPGMFERTVTVNSFSKTYSMTGWRLGYAVGPENLIKAMTLLQGSLTANVTAATQVAAIEALEGPQECIDEMVSVYQSNRDILIQGLNKIEGFSCITPEGAFYAFANIKDTGMSSEELAIRMLEKIQVVTTPGVAFGPAGEGYLRFSFAAGEDEIREALRRMEQFFG